MLSVYSIFSRKSSKTQSFLDFFLFFSAFLPILKSAASFSFPLRRHDFLKKSLQKLQADIQEKISRALARLFSVRFTANKLQDKSLFNASSSLRSCKLLKIRRFKAHSHNSTFSSLTIFSSVDKFFAFSTEIIPR